MSVNNDDVIDLMNYCHRLEKALAAVADERPVDLQWLTGLDLGRCEYTSHLRGGSLMERLAQSLPARNSTEATRRMV